VRRAPRGRVGRGRRRRVGLAPPLLTGLAAAQIGFGRLPVPAPPAATRAMLGLMLAASATEAAEARGRRGVAATAAAGAIGFAAELAGVATGRPFGRYRYSGKLGPSVRGVPILAAAAWALMARPAWVAAGHAGRVARVPLAAAALTAWDLFLDPRMAAEGYWTWERAGRYEQIPASNFAGWFATALPVFAVFAALDPEPPRRRDDGALALYAWTWLGETYANAVLWRRPRVAAAGGVAMGAVAVPAVWRRLRCG
jgi:uncharacterized membrane protein